MLLHCHNQFRHPAFGADFSGGSLGYLVAEPILVTLQVSIISITQLKDVGQIDGLGKLRGNRYVLSEQEMASLEQGVAG